MFGSHLSIAGGMVNALLAARRMKMDCVQVFTKNQRQWKAKPLAAPERDQWLAALRELNWDSFDVGGPHRVVSHNSYLINLASPDSDLWQKSVAAQREELERCEQLHVAFCVAHPGAHLNGTRERGSANRLRANPTRDERAGLKRIVRALNAIHRQLRGYRAMTCLETTVGSGTNLGYCFGQLAMIREMVKEPQRIGFCFDTCHVTAAGYDMSTPQRALQVLDEFDAICGLQNLKAFHFNDSVGPLGSRRDRHAHIGQGCCGSACFRTIANHPAFHAVPKLLETPKGLNGKGIEWDLVNLRRLKRMRNRRFRADNALSAARAAA
jgi:deoxyribonuclease-4